MGEVINPSEALNTVPTVVQSDGKYAIVVDYLDLQIVKRDLFQKKGFFQNILDVVIIVPGFEQGMSKSRVEEGK